MKMDLEEFKLETNEIKPGKVKIYKKPGMIKTTTIIDGEVPYISYDILEKTGLVINAFSTRVGGISSGYAKSMNFAVTREDCYEENENKAQNIINENYRIFCNAVGLDYTNVVTSDQTHTTNIRIVGKADCGKGILKKRDYHDIDGLITNEPEVILATAYADCVPLYFLDPVKRVIGLAHSGWRGTVNKIGRLTIEAMRANYSCKPEDIICCIGPSICVDCYEVSLDVIEEFVKNGFSREIYIDKSNGKFQLNLWKANKEVLIEAGAKEENIYLPDICTCCNKDFIFSHRGLNGKRGVANSLLMLK